jgi:hypothetical protein
MDINTFIAIVNDSNFPNNLDDNTMSIIGKYMYAYYSNPDNIMKDPTIRNFLEEYLKINFPMKYDYLKKLYEYTQSISIGVSDKKLIQLSDNVSLIKNKLLISKYFYEIDAGGGGNCLFYSLSYALFLEGINRNYKQVRQDVCTLNVPQIPDLEDFRTDDDKQKMCNDGEWGTNIELIKAAIFYKKPILVYKSDHDDGISKDCLGFKYIKGIIDGLYLLGVRPYFVDPYYKNVEKNIYCLYLPLENTNEKPLLIINYGQSHYRVLLSRKDYIINEELSVSQPISKPVLSKPSTVETSKVEMESKSVPTGKIFSKIPKGKVDDETVINLDNIYDDLANREFSINNIFFKDEKLYNDFHDFYNKEYVSKKSVSKKARDTMNTYYQNIIDNLAPKSKLESLKFFKDASNKIHNFVMGNIINVIRPYIYDSINIMDKDMTEYGKFIISGGEAFNFNVLKKYRRITPDIDTKFIICHNITKNEPEVLDGSKIEIVINSERYSLFLNAMHDMWYKVLENVLDYLNNNYSKIYEDLKKLNNIPEFKLLDVSFLTPKKTSENNIFIKRFTVIDMKIPTIVNPGPVFYDIPLFSIDMNLKNYKSLDNDFVSVPIKKPKDDDEDEEDEEEEKDKNYMDILLGDNTIDSIEGKVYSKKLLESSTLYGVFDCAFMKPNEFGYSIGFKDEHVEIDSLYEDCKYNLLYASSNYITHDIDNMIELKMRTDKGEKDKYRQEIISNPSNLIDLISLTKFFDKYNKCEDNYKKVKRDECTGENFDNCRINPMGLGRIIYYCAPPVWVLEKNDDVIFNQPGIIPLNYVDKPCCNKDLVYKDSEGKEIIRNRIIYKNPLSYYNYDEGIWEENTKLENSFTFTNPYILYRFNPRYFIRDDKDIVNTIKYDTDNIIAMMYAYLVNNVHNYNRTFKTEEDKIELKNSIGNMLFFYNSQLIDHSKVSLKTIVYLLRIFTIGLIYKTSYKDDGLEIDKILMDITKEEDIIIDVPEMTKEEKTVSNIFNKFLENIYNNPSLSRSDIIQRIRDTSFGLITERIEDRKKPTDVRKINILDISKQNLEYIKTLYSKDFDQRDKDIIKMYTYDPAFMKLNAKLRKNETKYLEKEKCMWWALLNAFRKAPFHELNPIVVYRGITGRDFDKDYLISYYSKGRISNQFTSTTVSLPVSFNFIKGYGCCILKLYLIKVSAIYIRELSVARFKNEHEILLPPGLFIHYIGHNDEIILENGFELGKTTIIECIATQVPDWDKYILDYSKSHGLDLSSDKFSKCKFKVTQS